MKSGERKYDFVEVMTCKHGCVNGGGQPAPTQDNQEIKIARQKGLYRFDSASQIKVSHQNPIALNLYDGILKGKVEKLLHNGH